MESIKYTIKLLPTEDHPLLHEFEAKDASKVNNLNKENDNEDENVDDDENEEEKADSWNLFKEEIQKHSEIYVKADENIELIENTTESI